MSGCVSGSSQQSEVTGGSVKGATPGVAHKRRYRETRMRGRQQDTPSPFAGPRGILLGSRVTPEELRPVFWPGLWDGGLEEEFY